MLRKPIITPALFTSKRFGSLSGRKMFKEQRTRVGSLLGFCAFAFVAASVALLMSQTVQADPDGHNALWPSAGQNLDNTRFQSAEHEIGVDNVSSLAMKWQFTTMGDVSATPAVDENNVYFPDWGDTSTQ
jgi:glucose dehydrogenase